MRYALLLATAVDVELENASTRMDRAHLLELEARVAAPFNLVSAREAE